MSPPAQRPTAPEGRTAAAGIPSRVAYRCYAPLARGDRIEQTLAAALAAFRAHGADPSHVAAHPEDVAALMAATTLLVLPQQACPRGQVRLALP